MNKESFIKTINKYKQFIDTVDKLNDLGVNLYEGAIADSIDAIFDAWLTEFLNKEDVDTIYWWLFEDVDKIIYDEDKEINVEKIEDLYDYLCKK